MYEDLETTSQIIQRLQETSQESQIFILKELLQQVEREKYNSKIKIDITRNGIHVEGVNLEKYNNEIRVNVTKDGIHVEIITKEKENIMKEKENIVEEKEKSILELMTGAIGAIVTIATTTEMMLQTFGGLGNLINLVNNGLGLLKNKKD